METARAKAVESIANALDMDLSDADEAAPILSALHGAMTAAGDEAVAQHEAARTSLAASGTVGDATRLTEVRVFREELLCPRCSSLMSFAGAVRTVDPPRYEHRCASCDHRWWVHERFPRLEYRTLEDA